MCLVINSFSVYPEAIEPPISLHMEARSTLETQNIVYLQKLIQLMYRYQTSTEQEKGRLLLQRRYREQAHDL